ncbi:MAG: hypothetical protein WKF71_16300 [Pyrinomonadaceae bacterium]|jgi:hypothetical protein
MLVERGKIMRQTVEAEIDASGQIKLLEPLLMSKKSRVIVIVLEESNSSAEEKGISKKFRIPAE